MVLFFYYLIYFIIEQRRYEQVVGVVEKERVHEEITIDGLGNYVGVLERLVQIEKILDEQISRSTRDLTIRRARRRASHGRRHRRRRCR